MKKKISKKHIKKSPVKCGWPGCTKPRRRPDELFCSKHEREWQEELAQSLNIHGADTY